MALQDRSSYAAQQTLQQENGHWTNPFPAYRSVTTLLRGLVQSASATTGRRDTAEASATTGIPAKYARDHIQ